MSAPLQHHDDVEDVNDPRLYAPRWARERPLPAAGQPQLISSPPVASAIEDPEVPEAPRMPRGIGGPNIEWAPRLPPHPEFGGDIAMRALRRRLALEPDVVPEPPIARLRESGLPWIARLGLLFGSAGIAAFGITLLMSSDSHRVVPVKGDHIGIAPPRAAASVVEHEADPARLLVEARQVNANEPLLLGVALRGASGNETVLLNGLAAGTRLTAGAPVGSKGWRLAASDLGKVLAYAPHDYVGAMEAAIDLRSAADALLDRQIIRLEWIPRQPQAILASQPPAALHRLDPDEIDRLVKRGQQYLQTGDIASARLMFRRAAVDGNALAALALGATFDPLVLRQLGVLGFAPNPAQARDWYQRAAELGSGEASRRLERLRDHGR